MMSEIHLPCDILLPFIKSYAIHETAEERVYKVLPDTGLVIGFQYKGKLNLIRDQKEILLATSGISGLAGKYKTFKSLADIGSVLIFFKEAGAVPFFKQPLHELFGESISLDNFMLRSELLALEEQLCDARSGIERIDLVEKFLINRMSVKEPDKLVQATLAHIHKCKGIIRIAELAKLLNTSQSPLEKRFRQAVGITPKKFASIIRFKHTIQNFRPDCSLTELGYESGFYDQAHFIKEFKNFTGETPEGFFTLDR